MDYVRLNHNLVHLLLFFLEFCLAVQGVLSQIIDVPSTGWIIDVISTGNLKSDFLPIGVDEEGLHGFLQLLLAVHHLVDSPEAQTFLVYVVCRLHCILSSLNMHITEFMFNWMVELHLIFIPNYFILILEEEIFDLESPFLHFWSDPVDKDIFRILPWLI